MRAVVVLPEPDSPTMPSVSPGRISNETSVDRGPVDAVGAAVDLDQVLGGDDRLAVADRGSDARLAGGDVGALDQRRQPRALRVGGGHGVQQRLRVLVLGVVEDLLDGALLDDLAEPHHRDVVGEAGDDGEVVADQDEAACRAAWSRRAGRGSAPAR